MRTGVLTSSALLRDTWLWLLRGNFLSNARNSRAARWGVASALLAFVLVRLHKRLGRVAHQPDTAHGTQDANCDSAVSLSQFRPLIRPLADSSTDRTESPTEETSQEEKRASTASTVVLRNNDQPVEEGCILRALAPRDPGQPEGQQRQLARQAILPTILSQEPQPLPPPSLPPPSPQKLATSAVEQPALPQGDDPPMPPQMQPRSQQSHPPVASPPVQEPPRSPAQAHATPVWLARRIDELEHADYVANPFTEPQRAPPNESRRQRSSPPAAPFYPAQPRARHHSIVERAFPSAPAPALQRRASYEEPAALRARLCHKCFSALDGDELVRSLGLCTACDARRRRQRTCERRAEKGRRLRDAGTSAGAAVEAEGAPLRLGALPLRVIRRLAGELPREDAIALRCCQARWAAEAA